MFPHQTENFREIKAQKGKYDLKGDWHRKTFDRISRIIDEQFYKEIKNGIKGFILHGDVGTGKTTLAKALGKDSYSIIFLDGSDIARGLYGQSEQRVTKVFDYAKSKRRAIILIDDCESVFPSREWIKGQSWHVSQINVFLHELDNLDTSKICVILTTNKFNLMDIAVVDRLYTIEFPQPALETLIAVAEQRCEELRLDETDVVETIRENLEKFKSLRSVEKLIMERYLEQF